MNVITRSTQKRARPKETCLAFNNQVITRAFPIIAIGIGPCHIGTMLDRSRKREDPSDVNQVAGAMVDAATVQHKEPESQKNPAAVALGRLGGLKGGKARAAKLSARQKRQIAKKAAMTRWSKTNKRQK